MQEIRFSEPLVRRAARRGVLRLLGPLFYVAVVLMAASVIFGAIRGDRTWFFGVTATVLALAIIVPIAAIRAHTRFAVEKFRGLDSGTAAIDLSSGRLRAASKIGTLDMPLSLVTRVWRYPDYWIPVSARGILMTVPLGGVPADVTATWEADLRSAGAKIA